MKYIFENILDNIDAYSAERPTISANPESQFNFILYIGHQTNNKGDTEKRQEEIIQQFTPRFEELKDIMDLCLESYYTDNILYFEEDNDFISYRGVKQISPEDLKRIKTFTGGQGFYKIYFNFTSNVTDMLKFFYVISNKFNIWGGHSLQKIYDTHSGTEVNREITFKFDRNFLPHLHWSDDKTKECRKILIKCFYEDRNILNLPADPDERIAYVDHKITHFITKIQVLDDWRQENDVD